MCPGDLIPCKPVNIPANIPIISINPRSAPAQISQILRAAPEPKENSRLGDGAGPSPSSGGLPVATPLLPSPPAPGAYWSQRPWGHDLGTSVSPCGPQHAQYQSLTGPSTPGLTACDLYRSLRFPVSPVPGIYWSPAWHPHFRRGAGGWQQHRALFPDRRL